MHSHTHTHAHALAHALHSHTHAPAPGEGAPARTRRRATGWGPQVVMLQQPGGKARYGVLCEDAREWPFGHAMSCVHGWADDAELGR